jgi:hypothetical protein
VQAAPDVKSTERLPGTSKEARRPPSAFDYWTTLSSISGKVARLAASTSVLLDLLAEQAFSRDEIAIALGHAGRSPDISDVIGYSPRAQGQYHCMDCLERAVHQAYCHPLIY